MGFILANSLLLHLHLQIDYEASMGWWEKIFAWDGYGFFGLVISIVGTIFTVGFAYSASRAAKSAEVAATDSATLTTKTLTIYGVYSELEQLISSLDGLRNEIDAKRWSESARRCSICQRIAARISASALMRSNEAEIAKMNDIVDQTNKIERLCLAPKPPNNQQTAEMLAVISSLASQCASMTVSIREQDDRLAHE